MFNLLRKAFVFITTGSMAVILAACYGVPVDEMYYKLVKTRTSTGEPIPGLRVRLFHNRTDVDTFYTNQDGEVEFDVYNETVNSGGYSIKIEDVDGEENLGEFTEQQIPIDDSHIYDVIMDEKDSEVAEK